MPEAYTIGPLLIPTRVAGFLIAALLALWLVRVLARFLRADSALSSRIAERSLWIGMAASRLGYVASNWGAFADNPWTAFYLWQPGYSAAAGIAAGSAYALYRVYEQTPALRNPVAASLCGGFTLPAMLFTAMLLSMNKFVSPSILTPGDAVPEYEIADLSGQSNSFSDFKGNGMVVNFWATWCAPCRREMPLLESIYRQYESRDIVVIGISVGESRAAVKRYVDSIDITYPIWGDLPNPGQTASNLTQLSILFGVVGLPTTFFIDRSGTIKSSHVGELNRAILEERIGDLMR